MSWERDIKIQILNENTPIGYISKAGKDHD